MRKLLLISVLVLFSISCAEKEKPENLLPEETYIQLVVEMQLLQNYVKQSNPDSTHLDSLSTAIFEAYNIRREQFYESHEYYQQNIAEQKERIKEAIELLRKDRIAKSDTVSSEDRNKESDVSTVVDSLDTSITDQN